MIDEKTGIEFPIFQKDLYDLFGTPNEEQFAEENLSTLDLWPYAKNFAHVLDFTGELWHHKIYCHYLMHSPLVKAFGLLVARGLADELKTYDGCWNIRRMSGGGGLSVHSWGLAVDFNARTNPYGGEVNFSDGFIRCFADVGFEAGALWRRPDGMHFQLCWTQDWRESDNLLKPVVWEEA